MAGFGPKSIRGKITLLACAATAVAMTLIVAVMGFTMRFMLESAIAESLADHIQQARADVEAGDYAAAVDSSGSEVIQIIDSNGNVVAESRNARGFGALDVGEGTTEVSELLFVRDDPPATGSTDENQDSTAEVHTADETNDTSVEGRTGDTGYGNTGAGGRNNADIGGQDSDDDDNDDAQVSDDDDDDDDAHGSNDSSEDADDSSDDADGDSDGSIDADDDAVEKHDAAKTSGDRSEGDGQSAERGSSNDTSGDDSDDPDNDDLDDPDDDGTDRDADDEPEDDSDDSDDKDEEDTRSRVALQSRKSPQIVAGALPWAPRVAWAEEEGAAESPSSTRSSSDSAPTVASSTASATASIAASSAAHVTEAVEARLVLGAEGPYIVQREEVNGPDGPMSIVGVASLASAVQSAWQMAGLLAAIMAVVLVAVAAFAWLLTGRTLRPVEDMRAKAASITAENLEERIDVPQSDKNLARLAETLNEMLARIGRALDEEKRFISDASHELKSPIAATSIILESLRAHPEALNTAHAIEDLTSENTRMASIVSDMLALTRYDEGRLACRPEPVDLMDLVMEESLSLQARCASKVDLADLQPVVCRADPGLLAHAIRNVLDNASHYAESLVKVSCGHVDGGGRKAVFVQVSDDGCGIAPADRERVFGRFVCLDEEHANPRGGTGLGLAVVASAIDAHGGSVAFVDPELGGATVRIEIPQE